MLEPDANLFSCGSVASMFTKRPRAPRKNSEGPGGLAHATDPINVHLCNAEEFAEWQRRLKLAPKNKCFVINGSPCLTLQVNDGRMKVSEWGRLKGKNMAGYHVQARLDHGNAVLANVKQCKSSNETPIISHLCGTKYCVTPGHTIVESKAINDDRTKCHFVLHNIIASRAEANKPPNDPHTQRYLATVLKWGCPHKPPCLTINPNLVANGDVFSGTAFDLSQASIPEEQESKRSKKE